jgi:bifunctional non-homologous end joining protein LigD
MERSGRFVVQRHERESQPVHWDLMLETGEVLETFRIDRPIEEWGKEPIKAEKIFDHPLKFLTYEGSVNKGKGKVTIADRGGYKILSKEENGMRVILDGGILKSKFEFKITNHK